MAIAHRANEDGHPRPTRAVVILLRLVGMGLGHAGLIETHHGRDT